jgi:hypothetical protein
MATLHKPDQILAGIMSTHIWGVNEGEMTTDYSRTW